jgi:hypothetical protein
VHRVLARLHAIWLAPLPEAVAMTNELLRDAAALPQLVHHEPIGWHVHAAAEDSGFATRLAVDTAMAIVDAIRAGAFEPPSGLRGQTTARTSSSTCPRTDLRGSTATPPAARRRITAAYRGPKSPTRVS